MTEEQGYEMPDGAVCADRRPVSKCCKSTQRSGRNIVEAGYGAGRRDTCIGPTDKGRLARVARIDNCQNGGPSCTCPQHWTLDCKAFRTPSGAIKSTEASDAKLRDCMKSVEKSADNRERTGDTMGERQATP